MHAARLLLGTLLAVAVSCSSRDSGDGLGDPSNPEGDGFAVGRQPLELLPAPAGLCLGAGTKKECETPGGCEDDAGGDPYTSGVGGSTALTPGMGGYPSATGGMASALGGYMSTGGVPGNDGAQAEAGTGLGSAGTPTTGVAGSAGTGFDGAAGRAGASSATAGSASKSSDLTPQAVDACEGIDRDEPAKLYLSADDSNSTASPVIARRLIRTGQPVPARVVRPWEFLNYYDFEFEPAEPGQVRIHPQLSSCPTDGELSFQVALQSERRDPSDRAPLNITFVLDTSGSMSGNPILFERAAVLAMARQLLPGDVVSMVTWSTTQQDILSGHEVTGPDDPVVLAAANSIAAGGGTDLHAGLTRGYAHAESHLADERINRVVLISDGQANVGITDEELIGEYADDEEGRPGIYLAGIGVGDGVNDTLMNVVTDAGRGAYVYLDSAAEAEKMLGDRFLQVVDVAARAVRLEMTLPWYMNVAKFFGEEISIDPTEVRPQHLGPNDAMLFFQILNACDPALIHGDDRIVLTATWEDPFSRASREATIDATLNALAGDDAALTKAAAIAGYAEALIVADQSSDTEVGLTVLREARDDVRTARGAGSDPDLVEIEELLTALIDR